MGKRKQLEQLRQQIKAQTEAYERRGGTIQQAPSGRRNPLNEDKHNTFLFTGRKR